MVFFLLFVFSTTVFKSNAQEREHSQLTYHEFYNRVHPLSQAQKFDYEQASQELAKYPTSSVATARLCALADQGHVPALHELIESKFKIGDVKAAQELSYTGACLGDPGCAITLATLYDQWSKTKKETTDVQEIERCQQHASAAEQWLRFARAHRFVSDETRQNVATYTNQEAHNLLQQLLSEKHKNFEQTLAKADIKKYEKEIGASGANMPLACFVIKENIAKGTHEPIKTALALCENIVRNELFDADYLHASGVRASIETLKEHSNQKIKERAVAVCVKWDATQSRMGKLVEAKSLPDSAKKQRFVTPDYSPEVLQELIEGASVNFEGADLVDAALYLHMHRNKDTRIAQAVQTYLDRALEDPSTVTRRALIEQCQTDKENLYPYYLTALDRYAHDLKSKALLAEEFDFMNNQLRSIMQNADNGDDDEAFRIYQQLTEFPECFNCVAHEDVQKIQTKYLKQALEAGNWHAMCCCLPKMRAMQSETSEQLSKAMKFWSKAYTASADLLASSPDVVEFAALNAEAFDRLFNLLSLKTETGTTTHDAAFYYHAATAFAHNDAIVALKAFQNALQVVFLTPNDGETKRKLYELTGMKAVLEKEAQRGQGWAYSAQAYYTFLAALNPGYPLDSRKHSLLVIQAIEQARTLLQKAAAAQVPHTEFAPLNEIDLDVKKGAAYYELYNIESNELYLRKAMELFESTVQKNSATGMYNWAAVTLDGHGEKGQAALEKSINYLIHATQNGCTSAEVFLKTIRAKGLLYVAGCGGIMSAELKSKINVCLESRTPRDADRSEQPAASVPVSMDPADEYRILKEKADQGNIEAMVHQAMSLKEGLGVQKSLTQSNARFADALLAWGGQKAFADEIAIAYNALTEVASTDLRSQIARCKANMYTLFSLNNLETGAIERAVEDTFKELKNMQRLMKVSGKQEDRELFYSTGLASLVQQCLVKYSDAPLQRFKVLNFYMQYAIQFAQEMENPDKVSAILNCVKEVTTKMEGFFFLPDIPVCLSDSEIGAFKEALASLSMLIDVKILPPQHTDELLYLKGLLMAYDSIAEPLKDRINGQRRTKPFTLEANQLFQELGKKGHLQARYMCAYIATHGHTICKKNPHQPTRGIALFEELAALKHVKSLMALVEIAKATQATKSKEVLHKNRKIEGYLKTVLEVEPRNQSAVKMLVQLYKTHPELKIKDESKS